MNFGAQVTRKIPISARLMSGSGWVDGMMLALDQGEAILSVTGNADKGR